MPEIRDIQGLESVFYSWSMIVAIVAILIVLVGFIIGLIIFLKKREGKKQPKIIEPAHVIALRALDELSRQGFLEAKAYKKYFFRQTEIFKTYLEDRYHIDVVEKTTEELQRELCACNDLNGYKNEIISFLSDTDLIKFSTFLPDEHKIKELSEYPRKFINETKLFVFPNPQPQNPKF